MIQTFFETEDRYDLLERTIHLASNTRIDF